MKTRRIVISGVGVVSPVGTGNIDFWKSLRNGVSGIQDVSLFDTSGLKIHKAGEIKDFDPSAYLGKKGLRSLDRSTLLLNTAAKLALDDAKLSITGENTDRIGVSIGATFGSLHSIASFDKVGLTEGPKLVNPSHFPNTVINSPASHVSIRFNIQGFNSTISTGMCASIDALIYALDFIRLNRADMILAGGVEELCEETFLGFYKTGHLSGANGSEFINCPFDKRRNGFILSEGSAVMVLESLENAQSRSAHIYGEILGSGSSFDPQAYKHFTPAGVGLKTAVVNALEDAQLSPSDIEFICAHADSSRDGDRMEARALKEIFHENLESIPVSAIKSMLGETYSASGSLAVAASIGAMHHSFVPPSINYDVKDPDCVLPGINKAAVEKDVRTALITAYDFHGNNSAIILGKGKL